MNKMKTVASLIRTFQLGLMAIFFAASSAFGADPGGYLGFVKAVFTGRSFDTTSDVWSQAASRCLVPNEIYASSLAEKTTVAFGTYMKMEAGVTYNFKGRYDDFATVKIGSTWVVSKGGECSERSGSWTPSTTDWYKVEFRVANNGGGGGCTDSSYFGILWKKSTETEWRQVCADGETFKTGIVPDSLQIETSTLPIIVSSSMRSNDATIMDVVYKVMSDKPTVNVRALAFEDGERSFWKVVRPETFVEGTAANIGDCIAANVEHTLSWKVSSDWKTDLAKVKFEILTSDMALLPLKTIDIPAVSGRYGAVKVYYNSQTAVNCFNALLWHYADAKPELVIDDGYLYWQHEGGTKTLLSNRTSVGDVPAATVYLYEKMGMEPLGGVLQNFVRDALRKDAWFNSSMQYAVKPSEKPTSLYIGPNAYWWIDLTTGAQGFLDSVPLTGWGDEYKTTKLLMRRIEPGDVLMGGIKPVTITKPFYIGVFEVTQKQYALINGSNPSSFKGDMRPVECVSYNDIRGTSKGAQWPNGTEFDSTSWLGKLKVKTGIAFDLPTESQWEYACRAGTTSYYNNGGSSETDCALVARFGSNRSDGKGGYSEHTTVGSYLPNGWGLYDMHGNVFEWCLDWYDWYGSINSDLVTDWVGVVSGSDRVQRGGDWDYGSLCRSYDRYDYADPSYWDDYGGFRLAAPVPAGLQ